MKKYINLSIIYAIFAMVGGVFYREFTKFNGFEGVTVLGKVHTHLFLLGMVVFLLVALFEGQGYLKKGKRLQRFELLYNIGVPLTTIMMVVRGVTQVLSTQLSSGMNAAISGISGIGHILTGIALILLLLNLKDSVPSQAGN